MGNKVISETNKNRKSSNNELTNTSYMKKNCENEKKGPKSDFIHNGNRIV